MINNKLGLKIVRTNQGYGDGLEVNGEQEWTKNVRDVREDLKNIENLQNDNSILMLTCIDGGHLFTIASLIAGRTTDYISAWIYIPSDLVIPGKILAEIIEVTKKEILAVERNDELLKSKFEKTYEIAQAKRTCQHAVGNQYAYRYYSNDLYTLQELLDAIHQPYYQKYKSIFFIDRSSKLSCIVGDDLSKEQLYTSILANAPKKADGFIPYVNGKVFDSPMYVSKGEVIEITWKKNGYEPIRTHTKANEGFEYIEPSVNQYRRLIPYDAISVFDERKQPIEQYKLSINHQTVNPGEAVAVSEAALNNVRIDIYADGYDSKGGTADFTKFSSVSIKLSKTSYEYKLAIPVETEENFKELIITTNRELEKSPIKGYVPQRGHFSRHNTTTLRYSPYNKTFWIQVAVVLSVVLILGVALGAWGWNKLVTEKLRVENNSLKYDIKQLEPKGGNNYGSQNTEENTTEQENDVTEVIEYLDNNNVWNREKMEGFPQIKGLWDAINTHDFGKVLELENTLKDSKRFMILISAIKANEKKSFTTNYNTKQNDFDITIEIVKDKFGNIKNKGYIKALYDAGGNSSSSNGMSNNASTPAGSSNNNKQDQWK